MFVLLCNSKKEDRGYFCSQDSVGSVFERESGVVYSDFKAGILAKSEVQIIPGYKLT
jgi:hypothetical protein